MFLGNASFIVRSDASVWQPLKICCLSDHNLGTRYQEETIYGNVMQDQDVVQVSVIYLYISSYTVHGFRRLQDKLLRTSPP